MRIRERFNPRAPCGARQIHPTQKPVNVLFQPTRPLRSATSASGKCACRTNISTHAPLAGRDGSALVDQGRACTFQPTRPLRGATLRTGGIYQLRTDFNPRAPCGARQAADHVAIQLDLGISTHAPPCGARLPPVRTRGSIALFQPTRPLRGATGQSPCAGQSRAFQPTRPLRGATVHSWDEMQEKFRFQPTRPLRGATWPAAPWRQTARHFNPRAPCGARQAPEATSESTVSISTHAPLAGRDRRWIPGRS